MTTQVATSQDSTYSSKTRSHLIPEHTLLLGDSQSSNPALVGSEAAMLSLIASAPGRKTPGAFIVGSSASQKFLQNPSFDELFDCAKAQCSLWLDHQIKGNQRAAKYVENALFAVLKDLREHIAGVSLHAGLKEEIDKRYKTLQQSFGQVGGVNVIPSLVHSSIISGTTLGQSPFELNLSSVQDVHRAVHAAYTNLFSPTLVMPRLMAVLNLIQNAQDGQGVDLGKVKEQAIDLRSMSAGIVVQQTINAVSGGTISNVDLVNGTPGSFLQVAYGLPETVTTGVCDPDTYRFDRYGRSLGVDIGNKERALYALPIGGAGPDVIEHSIRRVPTLNEQLAQRVVNVARNVSETVSNTTGNRYLELKFAVDTTGEVFILGGRPETFWSQRKPKENVSCYGVPVEQASALSTQYAGGKTAVHGAVSGTLRVLNSSDEIHNIITKGDIIVVTSADQNWDHVLHKAGAIIAEQGGITGLTAAKARELRIPCIVAAHGAKEALQELTGKEITFDASNRIVYEGKHPVQVGTPNDFIRNDIQYRPTPSTLRHPVYKQVNGVDVVGKPEYPLSKLQFHLYWKAWQQLEEQVASQPLNLYSEDTPEGTILLVGHSELEHLSKDLLCWKLEDLSLLLDRREKAVQAFRDLAGRFEVSELCINEQSLNEFCTLYPRMIAFAHLRWQLGEQVLAKLVKEQLEQLPSDWQDIVFKSFAPKEKSEAALKEAAYQDLLKDAKLYAPMLLSVRDSEAALAQLRNIDGAFVAKLEEHVKLYKYSTDDLRNKPAIIAVLNRIRFSLSNPELPGVVNDVNEPMPNWRQFVSDPVHFEQVMKLAHRQKQQTENEHHWQVRDQFVIQEKMLQFGNRLVKIGRLSKAEEIFDLLPSDIIDSIREIESLNPKIEILDEFQPKDGSLEIGRISNWLELRENLKANNQVLLMDGNNHVLPVSRCIPVGVDPYDSIIKLFDQQSRSVFGGYSKIDDRGKPGFEQFVKLYENGTVVDYVYVGKNGATEIVTGNPYAKKMPDNEVRFVVVQNSARAGRPGRAGGGQDDRVDPNGKLLQILRPKNVIENCPNEMYVEWKGPHGGTWWAMCNPFPIFPCEKGKPTFHQPYHVTFSRGDRDVDQPLVTSPENLAELLTFYGLLNRSLSLRASGAPAFRMGINGWYNSQSPRAPKGGASQFQAHAHLISRAFSMESAKREKPSEQNIASGVEVSLRTRNEVGSALILESALDARQIERIVEKSQVALQRIKDKGDTFNILVSPLDDRCERISLHIADKVQGTPVPHFDNEFAFCEVFGAPVVDSIAKVYHLFPKETIKLQEHVADFQNAKTDPEKAQAANNLLAYAKNLKQNGRLNGVAPDLARRVEASLNQVCAPYHHMYEIAQAVLVS
jgi:phosphohistidine swiveling domain-containing protein